MKMFNRLNIGDRAEGRDAFSLSFLLEVFLLENKITITYMRKKLKYHLQK